MFNVAIVGADNYKDKKSCTIKAINLLKNRANEGITLLSTGEDFINEFSSRFNIDTKLFYTDFKKYGKDALKYRNNELLDECDGIIIFNDGRKDTEYIRQMAISRNIPLRYIS